MVRKKKNAFFVISALHLYNKHLFLSHVLIDLKKNHKKILYSHRKLATVHNIYNSSISESR